jgi:small nuclear ribonucleoprotein (snRNP)-like protein
MIERQKIRDEEPQKSDKYLTDFVNKVVVCDTLSGKTITGVLIGFDKFELILVELKDIKSKNPKKTVIFKHGLISVKETE